ncbi:hypothetical protein C0J52_02565 [Blattella germanica]|nr:hypothetical protein C0J52_02565 [Blattella germanica]
MSFDENTACVWKDNECLDFKELEEQIVQIVDHGNLEEMLRIQLSELEMLQSMFSNPGEFSVYDHSVIADINEFVDGKSFVCPPRLDFTINLFIEKVRCMNWKKIMCKKKEVINLNSSTVDSLRKFPTFQEISFECGKSKSMEYHMDMGELYRYLAEHNCSYVFKDYFGVDGKCSSNSH